MEQDLPSLIVENSNKIIDLWEQRAVKRIEPAGNLSTIALRNELSVFLKELGTHMSSGNRSIEDHEYHVIMKRIAQNHGLDRAVSNYSIADVIGEFQILREVIFEILEEKEPVSTRQRNLILDALDSTTRNVSLEFAITIKKNRDRFQNTLIHDLLNPLSVMRTNAEIIIKHFRNSERCETSALRIISGVKRLVTMIEKLLYISKIRAGGYLNLTMEETDLVALIKEVVNDAVIVNGDRFTLDLPDELIGEFSKDGLKRALENLISNAIKYGTEGSKIKIKLRRFNDGVELEVFNEGSAISEKDQKVLFEEFRRLKAAENGKHSGWGLGLALVQGVASAHRGRVIVRSKEGAGTSFILEMPNPR